MYTHTRNLLSIVRRDIDIKTVNISNNNICALNKELVIETVFNIRMYGMEKCAIAEFYNIGLCVSHTTDGRFRTFNLFPVLIYNFSFKHEDWFQKQFTINVLNLTLTVSDSTYV